MKPARFSYEAPTSVEGVLAALAAHDQARIIAGGQSLAPMMNMRIAQPGHLVDINRVAGLGEIRRDGDHLACGALVRHAALARHDVARAHAPMLAHAAGTITGDTDVIAGTISGKSHTHTSASPGQQTSPPTP